MLLAGTARAPPRHRAPGVRAALVGCCGRANPIAPACTGARLHRRLGCLVEADLLNLGKIQGLGAPVASIGGAGTFDEIFLTGAFAVLLASISSPSGNLDGRITRAT